MLSNRFVKAFNYFYIFMALNYTYLVWFVFGIDFTGYGLLALTILSVLINHKTLSEMCLLKPFIFWLLWLFYSLFNYELQSSGGSFFYIIIKLWVPLNTMLIVCHEYKRNPKSSLRICVISFIVFLLLGLFFDINLLYRNLGGENTLGNYYANTICLILCFLSLLNNQHVLNTPLYIFLSAIVIFILALCGVRKAFVAGLIFFIFWLISILDMRKTKNIIFVPIVIIVFYFGYNNFIKDSYVMVRMEKLEEQQLLDLPADAPSFLLFLGDRGPQYYYGWKMFLEEPFFGVGLENANIGNARIHSEYMVELVENGILGFSLFFAFNIWIFINVYKRWKHKERMAISIMGGVVGLWFLYLTSWSWDSIPDFILLGTVVGYLKYKPNEIIIN